MSSVQPAHVDEVSPDKRGLRKEDLYAQYIVDPQAVSPEYRAYFDSLRSIPAAPARHERRGGPLVPGAGGSPPRPADPGCSSSLRRTTAKHGHRAAALDHASPERRRPVRSWITTATASPTPISKPSSTPTASSA